MVDIPRSHSDARLTQALGLNALLSLSAGALLLIAPTRVAAWIGADIAVWLRALGLFLIVHAAALAWARRRPPLRRWATLNLAVIGPYPLVLLTLLLTGAVDTTAGRVLLLADAAAVGTVAVLHGRGLLRPAAVASRV